MKRRSVKMNDTIRFLVYLAVMVLVTYLLRLIPMLFIRKNASNRFCRSVIYYIPYCVLAAMTFPAIFYIAPNLITGIVATVTALVTAWFSKNLLLVASLSAASILIMELLIIPLI